MKNMIKKRGVALVLLVGLVMASPAAGATVAELQAHLQALQAQLGQLQGQSLSNTSLNLASCAGVTFSRTLRIGSSGADVRCLQVLLNQDMATKIAVAGPGSPGNESTYFGARTKQAVMQLQQKYADEILVPSALPYPTGVVGPATNVKLNSLLAILRANGPSAFPVSSPLSPSPLSQAELTTAAIAKANPAVVSIVVTKQVPEYEVVYQDPFGNGVFRVPSYRPTGRMTTQKLGAGSGFLVTSDGYLVTNKHVAFDTQATYTITLNTGTSQSAQLIYQDLQHDVAILKILGTTPYPFITLGNSDTLQLGQPVIAIGNALGQFSNSVSVGIVSGLHRTISATGPSGLAEILEDVIQTDAAINVGNSGGPLLDLQGNAVGINVATVQGSSNISFALPINPVKVIISSVLGR